MAKLTAQQMYDDLYIETIRRHRTSGKRPPTEVEVFKVLVQWARNAIADGELEGDFLNELEEVKPQIAIEKENARRMEDRERALREGTFLDLDDLK